MARQVAALGYDLALAARRRERLRELRQEILDRFPAIRVEVAALDVTDDASVFEVFRSFAATFGELDRVVVNAGVGKGAPLGTGRFDANRETAMTNFVSALAQCEAAMEIFRAQQDGHLVVMSSLSALRGMPRSITTYAATKAGIATLAEGIRIDVSNTPIKVTTIFPGYITSEMTDRATHRKVMMAATDVGTRSIVRAIEREVDEAICPPWPWIPMGFLTKHAPRSLVRRFM
jgi:short-subunit dehydrogenase